MVFLSEPPPVFLGMDGPAAWQSPPNDRVEAAIMSAREDPQDAESVQAAFDIFRLLSRNRQLTPDSHY